MQAEDPEVAPLIRRCVLEKKTLTATFTYEALTLADVVVVDVQCDYHKETLGNVRQGRAEIAALEDSLKVIGEKIPPGLPGADRNHGAARHHRICGLSDHQKSL